MNKVNVIKNDYLGIYSNAFVVTGKEHNVIVDSGLNGNQDLIAPYCTDKKLILLATHGHWDHIGLHSYLKARGAVLYAHKGDKRYLKDFAWHWEDLFGQYENDFDLPSARRTTFHDCIGSPVAIDINITDGMKLSIEDMIFNVIHTPGHSDGSVCLLEEKNKVLFTGDSLMGDGFFTGLPQYTNPSGYISSMERLEGIEADMIYSCHNEPIKGDLLGKIARQGIDRVHAISDTIKTYVYKHRNEALTLRDIVAYTCEKQKKSVGGGACVTVMAHLNEMKDNYPALDAIISSHSVERCGHV